MYNERVPERKSFMERLKNNIKKMDELEDPNSQYPMQPVLEMQKSKGTSDTSDAGSPVEDGLCYFRLRRKTKSPVTTKPSLKLEAIRRSKAAAIQVLLFGHDDISLKERIKQELYRQRRQIRYVHEPRFMNYIDPNSAIARAYELNLNRQEVRQALLQVLEMVAGDDSATRPS
ncbi:unnamed protein product [Dicrocoelium dendriticum]|nr:unnamed protein product [Dicrocoelium dendriticum]